MKIQHGCTYRTREGKLVRPAPTPARHPYVESHPWIATGTTYTNEGRQYWEGTQGLKDIVELVSPKPEEPPRPMKTNLVMQTLAEHQEYISTLQDSQILINEHIKYLRRENESLRTRVSSLEEKVEDLQKYRILSPADTVKEGDELRDRHFKQWRPVKYSIGVTPCVNTYRRKIS